MSNDLNDKPGDGFAFSYFKQFHRALGIHTTLQCPLECAHCFIYSSPQRKERINHELIVQRIREIGREGRIKLLIISGGEPFLTRKTLQTILAIAHEYGIFVSVNTSAYFASTLPRAMRFLEKFPGLTHLAVSADQYHLAFTPLLNVRYALVAALQLGINATVMIRVWDVENDPFLNEIYAVLGEELLGQIRVDLAPLEAHGRGETLTAPIPPVKEVAEWPEQACDLAHQPVIDYDGQVLACCAYNIARHHQALQLGNIREQSLAEISRASEHNLLLQAIRVWGPKRLAQLLSEQGLQHRLKGSYRKDDICALCQDIVSQPDLVVVLRELLAQPEVAAELALSRILRYGEITPDLPDSMTEPAHADKTMPLIESADD